MSFERNLTAPSNSDRSDCGTDKDQAYHNSQRFNVPAISNYRLTMTLSGRHRLDKDYGGCAFNYTKNYRIASFFMLTFMLISLFSLYLTFI